MYTNIYAKITRNNGISNSFLMNSVWNGRFRMKHFMGDSFQESQDKCLNDLDLFRESYLKEEVWALRMLDSTSHIQSGFLQGNIINLGDFKECLSIDERLYDIKGQYCIITLFTAPSDDSTPFVSSHYNIQSALCLPSSCSIGNMTALLKNGLQELSSDMYFSIDDCETAHSLIPNRGPLEIFILCCLLSLGLLNIVATSVDILTQYGYVRNQLVRNLKNGKHSLLNDAQQGLLSFSLKLNLRRLVERERESGAITCLWGIRFISACMILSIHRIISDPQPFTNLFMLDDEVRKWSRIFQMNAYLFVDVFFVISGLLFSYNSAKIHNFSGFKIFIHRYLRLTPTLAVCISLAVLLDMCCYGPYCNSINRLMKEQCLNNSVYTLMYINNFLNSSESCLPHTWYLSADMQLYFISSILLIFARNRHSHIHILLIVYWISSVVITFTISYAYNIHAGFIGTTNSYEIDAMLLYEQFYTRAGPWAIGFALGLRIRESRLPQLGRVAVIFGWISATLLLLIAYFGVYPFVQRSYQHEKFADSIYNTFSHNGFAIGVAWIIYSCHYGYGGFLNDFLSSVVFQCLGKISYCFYLLHPLVQAIQYSQIVSARTYSDYLQMSLLLGDVFYSLIFALILHLTVEAPFINIEKIIWKRYSNRTVSRKTI